MRENRYFKGLEIESIIESTSMSKPHMDIDESKVPATPDALIEHVKACINEMNAENMIAKICINESSLSDKVKNAWKAIKDFFMKIWNSVMGFLNRVLKKKPKIARGPIVKNPESNKGDVQHSSNPSDSDDALDKFGDNGNRKYIPSVTEEPFTIKIESEVFSRNGLYLKYKEKCKNLRIEEDIYTKLKTADMDFINKQVAAYRKLMQYSDDGEFSEDKLDSPTVFEYNGIDESSKHRALADYSSVVEIVVNVSMDFNTIKNNMSKHGGSINVDIQPDETEKEEAITAISKMEQKRLGVLYHIVTPMISDMERLRIKYVKHNLLN